MGAVRIGIKAFTEAVYAFGKLPRNANIVDVGGGLGQVSLRIVEKILGLSFTVQGQARVIEIATSGGLVGSCNSLRRSLYAVTQVPSAKGTSWRAYINVAQREFLLTNDLLTPTQ